MDFCSSFVQGVHLLVVPGEGMILFLSSALVCRIAMVMLTSGLKAHSASRMHGPRWSEVSAVDAGQCQRTIALSLFRPDPDELCVILDWFSEHMISVISTFSSHRCAKRCQASRMVCGASAILSEEYATRLTC